MSDKHGLDPDPDTGAVLGGILSPQGAGARSCGTWEVTSASMAPTETTVTVPIPIGPTCPKCGGEMAVQKIEHPGGWVCLRCNPPPAGPQVSEAEIIEVAAWLTGKEQVTGAEALLAIEAGWGRLLGQRDGAQRLAEERGQEVEGLRLALERLLTGPTAERANRTAAAEQEVERLRKRNALLFEEAETERDRTEAEAQVVIDRPESEVERLRSGLEAAAGSLEALAHACGRDDTAGLRELIDVRGYAARHAARAWDVLG
jgi:hypothetical protein